MNLAKLVLAAATAATLSLAAIAPVFAQDAPMVVMQGNAFGPADVTVPVGTTLTWVNTDPEEHDVLPSDPNFSLDPNFFSPTTIAPGTSWSYTFTVPGTYAYMCDLHPDMYASVTVA